MKLKHSALLALTLWLGVVAWVSAMIVAKPSVASRYASGGDSAAMAQLQLQLEHNRQLLAALDALAGSRSGALAGPVVSPEPAPVAGADNATGEGIASSRVSVIIASGRVRRAVVDGELVRAGMVLADGSRVHAIGRDWVRLVGPTGELSTLQLPRPYAGAPARVGR